MAQEMARKGTFYRRYEDGKFGILRTTKVARPVEYTGQTEPVFGFKLANMTFENGKVLMVAIQPKTPKSGFRCQECRRAVPAGRRSCAHCGSEDIDITI